MSTSKKGQSGFEKGENLVNHHEYIQSLGLSPTDLIKDYMNVRALSVGPQARNHLEKLVNDSQEDLKNLARILRHFDNY